ncbi:MAG: hypothetical protein ACI841_002842 [Planctomycetota bacterium]|jgi:hypothetical protein
MPKPPSISDKVLQDLIHAGDDAWHDFRAQAGGQYHHFVPSDHLGAYDYLCRLRSRADSFVELGAGVGVVTIMADLLGFDAYGIEIESALVDRALEIAARFESSATFAEGTFVAADYQNEIQHLSGDFFTPTEGPDAFAEIGLDLSDFDLVFAYPWPGEEDWLMDLVRSHARASTLLLTYHPDGGFQVTEAGA